MIENVPQQQIPTPTPQPVLNQPKPMLPIILALIIVALVSGGVYYWQKSEIKQVDNISNQQTPTNTPSKVVKNPPTTSVISPTTKTVPSTGIDLEINNNKLEIKEGKLIRPVLKMVSESLGSPTVDYKLYLVRKSDFSDGNQPNCNEAVYLQKDAGSLKKVTEGNSCEFTFLADMGFLSNTAKFFFVQIGGDGSVMTLYNLDGGEIKFSDEKNTLIGWNIGSIDEFGWAAEYKSTVATFHLWKELGAQNATVRVDMEKMKVFSETFKNTGPTR